MSNDDRIGVGFVLDEVETFLRRYVVFASLEQCVAVSVWILHAHTIDQAEATPYLAITSPEKQAGKTRLLDCLALLVPRPWRVIQPSDAVLFRMLHEEHPTLLLDESDTIFGPNARPYDSLRGILNAGNRRGTKVPRCVGDGANQQLKSFDVYGAKAIAGIGNLPDTIADRSICIRLQRRSPREKIERFRQRDAERLADPIRQALEEVAETLELSGAEPEMPEALSDRAADSWESLFAIAESAGSDWYQRVHDAAIKLTNSQAQGSPSFKIELLGDVREILVELGTTGITTHELLQKLNARSEAPWRSWNDRGLNAHNLARLLQPFGVRSRQFRNGGPASRGYKLHDLESAFERYLPPLPLQEDDEALQRDAQTRVTLDSQLSSESKGPERNDVTEKTTLEGTAALESDEPLHPSVRNVLDIFPGAQIEQIRRFDRED